MTTPDQTPAPLYAVGYQFAFLGERRTVIDVQWDATEGVYVYLCEDDMPGVLDYCYYAEEMTASWLAHVAAETARLVQQANALPGQTHVVVALTAEEQSLLADAMLMRVGMLEAMDHPDAPQFAALYDKLTGKGEGR